VPLAKNVCAKIQENGWPLSHEMIFKVYQNPALKIFKSYNSTEQFCSLGIHNVP